MPKRGRSAYILFGMDKRATVKTDFPELTNKEIMSKLGELWSATTPEEKKPYEEKAAEEKEVQTAAIAAYKKKNPVVAVSSKGESTTKRAKKSKDPNMPKRGRSSYILFGMDAREKIKTDFPELKSKEIMAKLGELWNAASAEEKKKYEDLAAAEKKVKDVAIAEYLKENPDAASATAPKKSSKVKKSSADNLANLSDSEQKLQKKIDASKKCLKDCGVTVRDLTKDAREDRLEKLKRLMVDNEVELSWSKTQRGEFKREREAKKELEDLNSNPKFMASSAKRKKAKIDYSVKPSKSAAAEESSDEDAAPDSSDESIFDNEESD